MSGVLKKIHFWLRRRSYIMVVLIGALVITMLFFNEDASIKLNLQYEQEINELKREIKINEDSATYYRGRREALLTDDDALEHLAREQYGMQRPTEDVYLIENDN